LAGVPKAKLEVIAGRGARVRWPINQCPDPRSRCGIVTKL
jgi:hypothetical protein